MVKIDVPIDHEGDDEQTAEENEENGREELDTLKDSFGIHTELKGRRPSDIQGPTRDRGIVGCDHLSVVAVEKEASGGIEQNEDIIVNQQNAQYHHHNAETDGNTK